MLYNRIFEQAHKDGAEQFGIKWIDANKAAIEVAQDFDLEDRLPEAVYKSLLSSIVLAVLKSQREA